MNDTIRRSAERLREAMPCSVTMPAGTGKTEIVATLAFVAAEAGQRALILTHTNAGVEALRRRTRRLGVAANAVRIETIASWAHHLVRQYPQLAGVSVPTHANWSESKIYYDGALKVLSSAVMRRVLPASYGFVIVDEYQDCNIRQHALVMAIAEVLPLSVFGDPMQAIFDFDADPLVSWSTDVAARWPALAQPFVPWRWRGHNDDLGQWLIDIREDFALERPISITATTSVRWIKANANDFSSAVRACRDLRNEYGTETIVAIGRWARDCNGAASRLNGTYTVMETIEGEDMIAFARMVDQGHPNEIAAATAQIGKDCASGVAGYLTSDDVKKLRAGKTITHLKRPGAEDAQRHLSALLDDPAPRRIMEALTAIAALPGIRRYRHDAWSTITRALALACTNNTTVEDAVVRLRNQTRVTGRTAVPHVLARPTLIKGLEYDHAIILNADGHTPTSLYVALTRPRKTLTIISASPYLSTVARARERRTPRVRG
ncbi:UvrD-helicase domain-containing protein [Micromonospora sp. NPDC049051]|uniref:UvrD-helicase domain-containing protein n=1 Tax=Micromonospora sp. NPDC049051 TaxID=3364264 RepID=UPI0037139ACC